MKKIKSTKYSMDDKGDIKSLEIIYYDKTTETLITPNEQRLIEVQDQLRRQMEPC